MLTYQSLTNNRSQIILLSIASIAWLFFYSYFFVQISEGIMPFWNDEYGYFLDAQSFALNDHWVSATLMNNELSGWGEFGTHGPGYFIIYGAWLKLFPDSQHLAFPYLHLSTLFIGSLILWFSIDKSDYKRWLMILLFVSNAVFAILTYTYMVETIQGLFSIIMGLLLLKIYERPKQQPSQLALYIILIFILSIIRATWVFWLVGLLPLAKTMRQFIINTILCILGICVGFVLFKLSHAPYPAGFLPHFTQALKEQDTLHALVLFWEHLLENLYTYFRYVYSPHYFIIKYWIVVGSFILFWYGYKHQQRLVIATALIVFVSWLNIMLFYSAVEGRDLRVLAAPFFLALFVTVLKLPKQLSLACLLLQLCFFPFVWQDTNRFVKIRQGMFQLKQENKQFEGALLSIKNFVDAEQNKVMLAGEYIRHGEIIPLLLPLQSNQKTPIIYSIQATDTVFQYPFVMPLTTHYGNAEVIHETPYFRIVQKR